MNQRRLFIRKASTFITSPIFYANAEPHIGHAYTAVLCDTAHRWNLLKNSRNKGSEALFSIGTDEHGSKIFQASQLANTTPKPFCDEVSSKFSILFSKLNLAHTHFIRTTDPEHASAVQYFWKILQDKGHIYKSSYSGYYSIAEECFVPENEVDKRNVDGKEKMILKSTSTPVEWIEEENYMFRLSQFREKVGQWIEKADVVRPVKYKALALDSLTLEGDLSISRTRSRLTWGIPVPNDPSHTIYVWMDALVNYLTVSGYPDNQLVWPPTCQIIGKDITKFHLYYWPAFLFAAGLPLPERVLVHGHWLVGNVKMSKSLGNVVNPNEAIDKFTSEGLRYFLLKQGNPGNDCSFSWSNCLEMVNSDLVNNVGNLLNRSTVRKINTSGEYPKVRELESNVRQDADKLMEMLEESSEKCIDHYNEMVYYKVIEQLMLTMKEANRVFQLSKPWQETDTQKLESVIFVTYETIRIVSILLQPITPRMSSFCLDRLGVNKEERCLEKAKIGSFNGGKLGADQGVFIERIQK